MGHQIAAEAGGSWEGHHTCPLCSETHVYALDETAAPGTAVLPLSIVEYMIFPDVYMEYMTFPDVYMLNYPCNSE